MTMQIKGPLAALLVDPSLFTAPYDAALTEGLLANDVDVRWVIRPYRDGEEGTLHNDRVLPLFYRSLKGSVKNAGVLQKAKKGLSHVWGCIGILRLARSGRFNIVHFQWAVLPLVDVWVFRAVRRVVPVVLTVHDLSPFNGNPSSKLQVVGFDKVLGAATYIIVHTSLAKDKLVARGLSADKIRHIPHGPLSLRSGTDLAIPPCTDHGTVWTLVLFGKIQEYKGADVLIEALGSLRNDELRSLRVVVAGESFIALDPLVARAKELGIQAQIEFRNWRHSEAEMVQLFAEADAFIFPYRAIEASGVLYLVQGLGKWIVASDLGAFSDMIVEGKTGSLVPPGNPVALADAMTASVKKIPDMSHANSAMGWTEIGGLTRRLYDDAISTKHSRGAA